MALTPNVKNDLNEIYTPKGSPLPGDPPNVGLGTAIDTMQGQIATLQGQVPSGYTGTIVTAKLTVSGTEGSMTFTNGVLTAQTAAT